LARSHRGSADVSLIALAPQAIREACLETHPDAGERAMSRI